MNARILAAAALGALLAGASPALAGDVSLTIAGGRVTLVARNATPRQILEAWSRQGHTRIVNAERVSGGPTTLFITNEPESKALAIVLRSAAGYIAAPRRVAVANASQYDRILIMPTSYAAPPAPAYRASAPAPPMMQQPLVEVPPDPTSLANDDGATAQAPVFGGDPNGMQAPAPPVSVPTQGVVLPYNPPPPDQNGDQQTAPPVLPSAGQQTAGAPGVLPVPQPSQPQPQQQPR